MTELVALRERAKHKAAERGVKLNYLPFIVKAIVSGLKKWPMLNASLDETTQEIVLKKYYHIGIAAQGPAGLVVTNVRDADMRSIFDISREIDRLAEAVRNNTATREDLTGTTFTVSSLGKLGGVRCGSNGCERGDGAAEPGVSALQGGSRIEVGLLGGGGQKARKEPVKLRAHFIFSRYYGCGHDLLTGFTQLRLRHSHP